jgi:hypothetical protein
VIIDEHHANAPFGKTLSVDRVMFSSTGGMITWTMRASGLPNKE